jgi:uncharacterized protein (TIGR02246 family)
LLQRFRVVTLAALLALVVQPLAAQAEPAVGRELDALYASFRDAYARLDVEAVTGLYARDAIYLSAGQPPARGRAAIRAVFEPFFGGIRADGGALAIEFRIVRRDVTPSLATDVGYYRLAVVRDGRQGKPSFGRFVTVSRRDADGRLRFVVDSYAGADAAEWDASAP